MRERARRALDSWLERVQSIIEEGQRQGEIRSDVDSSELATSIVSTLEGSLMVARLQRKENPRHWAGRHLEEYLETEVRAKDFKGGEKMTDTPGTRVEPDFRSRAKTNDVPIARPIGFEAQEIAGGRAIVTLVAGPQHANPMGTLHGGILCDIADGAMGMAFASTLGPKESFTTVELEINFFRSVWEAQLKAEGRVVRRGRSLAYVECDVTDESGRLVAKASSTCLALRGDEAKGR